MKAALQRARDVVKFYETQEPTGQEARDALLFGHALLAYAEVVAKAMAKPQVSAEREEADELAKHILFDCDGNARHSTSYSVAELEPLAREYQSTQAKLEEAEVNHGKAVLVAYRDGFNAGKQEAVWRAMKGSKA
jgi:hypothetical protein